MYCNNCGRRVRAQDVVCPECGSELAAEYCGGFWGLVNDKPEATEPAVAVIEEKQPDNSRKTFGKKAILVLLILFIAVSTVLIQRSRINHLQKEIGDLQSKYEVLEKEYSNLESNYTALQTEHSSLEQNYDELQKEQMTQRINADKARTQSQAANPTSKETDSSDEINSY